MRLFVLLLMSGLAFVPEGAGAEDAPASTAASKQTDQVRVKPVCLVALGPMDEGYMGPSRAAIEAQLGIPTKVLAPAELPKQAYYPKRKRYRAEKLLLFLNRDLLPNSGCRTIIGMTSVDISTTKGSVQDWGIFGLGEMPGTACVVSIYRLVKRHKMERKAGLKRVIKVVLHEVGHTLGLYHCETPKCLMNDAQGTVKTVDNESGALCEVCQGIVRSLHTDMTVSPAAPDWGSLLKE